MQFSKIILFPFAFVACLAACAAPPTDNSAAAAAVDASPEVGADVAESPKDAADGVAADTATDEIAAQSDAVARADVTGACPSVAGADGGLKYPDKPIPYEQLLDAFEAVICQQMIQCNDGLSIPFATIAGCKSFTFLETDRVSNGFSKPLPPGVVYNPTIAGQCIAAMSALSCADHNEQPTECHGMFTGTLAIGSACVDSGQCACGYCAFAGATCAGVCQTRVGKGDMCKNSSACPDNYSCNQGKCMSNAPGPGEACFPGSACPPNHHCALVDANAGICKKIQEPGQACTSNEDCSTGCNADGKCANLPKPGQDCTSQNCVTGELCMGLVNGQGKCKVPALGDPCSGAPDSCGLALRCLLGSSGPAICQPAAGLGEACIGQGQCKGIELTCILQDLGKGKCQLVPGKGAACSLKDPSSGLEFSCMPPYLCIAGVCADPPGLGESCNHMFSLGLVPSCAGDFICDSISSKCKVRPGKGEACVDKCKSGSKCVGAAGQGVCQEVCL